MTADIKFRSFINTMIEKFWFSHAKPYRSAPIPTFPQRGKEPDTAICASATSSPLAGGEWGSQTPLLLRRGAPQGRGGLVNRRGLFGESVSDSN
ncbi:MAG: hypothetical protein RLZZ352_1526 [Pseudomonadota bacterium]|jgi:hypothetical protein